MVSLLHFRKLYISVILIVLIVCIGIAGYIILEHYNFLDAFYMTVITVATVGFQEVHPLDDQGKIFTAFLIITSFGTFAYAVTSISKYVVDGEFNQYFKNLKVNSAIEKLDKHVIICGFGRNGKQAAHVLKKHKTRFVVIEQKKDIISSINHQYADLVLEGDATLDESIIEEQNKNNVQEPQYISGGDGEIWIWKQPEEGHQYIMGVDVSRGDGEDSSTIVMLDFTTMEQVMEYQGKIQPDLLAQIVEEYGELYKAYTVVDITGGMGVSTVLKLLEFDYKRLHYDTPNGKILSSKQKQMEAFKKNDKVPGLQVSSIRIQMISNFEEKVRNNLVKIRSVRLTSEMKTFVYKNGRPDHMDGYHDDLIMSLAMCLWVLEHSFKNLERLEKQTKAMLNSWVNAGSSQDFVEDRFRGTGFVPKDNRNKLPTKRPNFSPVVSRNMQDPTGQYMWLFSGTK